MVSIHLYNVNVNKQGTRYVLSPKLTSWLLPCPANFAQLPPQFLPQRVSARYCYLITHATCLVWSVLNATAKYLTIRITIGDYP